MEDSEVKAKD